MQTFDELKYSQSIWGFQAGKAKILKVCDVKEVFKQRNHLRIDKDKFKQRCQIIPLKRKKLTCPTCGTEILLATPGRERYVQGLPNGKLLTFFKLTAHKCWCPKCQKTFYETFSFLSSPKARCSTKVKHHANLLR